MSTETTVMLALRREREALPLVAGLRLLIEQATIATQFPVGEAGWSLIIGEWDVELNRRLGPLGRDMSKSPFEEDQWEAGARVFCTTRGPGMLTALSLFVGEDSHVRGRWFANDFYASSRAERLEYGPSVVHREEYFDGCRSDGEMMSSKLAWPPHWSEEEDFRVEWLPKWCHGDLQDDPHPGFGTPEEALSYLLAVRRRTALLATRFGIVEPMSDRFELCWYGRDVLVFEKVGPRTWRATWASVYFEAETPAGCLRQAIAVLRSRPRRISEPAGLAIALSYGLALPVTAPENV